MARWRKRVLSLSVLMVCLLAAGWAGAAEEAAGAAEAPRGGMSILDWTVVALYAVGMLAVGAYYARHTETSDEYYLGGRRMSPSLVGLSLFATLISTISYLAVPGEIIEKGPIATLMYVPTIPFVFLVVGYIFIPHITKLPITSAYELLETRLGRPARITGSIIFVLIRVIWMGLVVYTAAGAVVTATNLEPVAESMGLDPSMAKYAMIVALAAITIIYSSLGGLRAVVITDSAQCIILFVGALATVIIVTVKMKGFGWFPTEWAPNWDKQPLFSFDPSVRVTMVGSLMATFTWWICTAGSDQMAIQRYLSTRDSKTARRAFLTNNIADVTVATVLLMVGFALLGFFRAHPELLPEGKGLKEGAETLFPHFIVSFMGYGTAGLVLSGMMAAAMSSLSSGVNSAATVINVDIVGLIWPGALNEKQKISLGKWMSLAIGVIVIGFGLIMEKVPGNLFEVTQKTNGLFVAPLFSLFFMAMFVPFATGFGCILGAAYGVLAAILIAFSAQIGGQGVSFQFITPGSLLVGVAGACLFSLIPVKRMASGAKVIAGVVCCVPWITVFLWFLYTCLTA